MRRLCFVLALISGTLAAQPPLAALVFIDSGQPAQLALVNSINQMLFYSPTLQTQLQVTVYDSNPHAAAFAGVLRFVKDNGGQNIARYRPASLPFLICLEGEQERLRMGLNNQEQLCLCTQGC